MTKVEIPKAKKKSYRPPRNGVTFVKMWNLLIGMVTERANFKESHLYQLEILCDLYQEYQNLRDTIEEFGFSYTSNGGRNGDQVKPVPEVAQMNRVRAEIREYSKMLGIVLTKDSSNTGATEAKDEWV